MAEFLVCVLSLFDLICFAGNRDTDSGHARYNSAISSVCYCLESSARLLREDGVLRATSVANPDNMCLTATQKSLFFLGSTAGSQISSGLGIFNDAVESRRLPSSDLAASGSPSRCTWQGVNRVADLVSILSTTAQF